MRFYLAFKDPNEEKKYKRYNFSKREHLLQMQRWAVCVISFLGIFHLIYLHPKQEEISVTTFAYVLVGVCGVAFSVLLGFCESLRKHDWVILITNLVMNFILIEPNFLVIAEIKRMPALCYFWLGFRISSINLVTLMCLYSFIYKIMQTSVTIVFLMIRMRNEATVHNLLVDSCIGIMICIFFYNQEKGERVIYHDLYGISVQKESWKDFLNFLPDGINIFSKSFESVFANESLKTIFKASDQDEMNRTILNLDKMSSDFTPIKDPRSPAGHRQTLKTQILRYWQQSPRRAAGSKFPKGHFKQSNEVSKNTFDFEFQDHINEAFLTEHDGKFLSIRLIHICYDNNESTLVLITDVSVSLKAQRLAIEENKKFRDMLFASFSHEIRTPLNCMLLLLGKLKTKEQSLSKKLIKKYIYPSFYSGQILLHLVNNILDYSFLLRNDLNLKIKSINIKSECVEVMEIISVQAALKGIKLILKLDLNLPEVIRTDASRLKQVLCHLLLNALKFTYFGFITLTVASSLDREHGILISVKDTGIGIKEEDQKRLREKLQMSLVSNKVTEHAAGASLKIVLCESLARKLGFSDGRGIFFVSRPEKGSAFAFVIQNFPDSDQSLASSKKFHFNKKAEHLHAGITVRWTSEGSFFQEDSMLKSKEQPFAGASTFKDLSFIEKDLLKADAEEEQTDSVCSEHLASKSVLPIFENLVGQSFTKNQRKKPKSSFLYRPLVSGRQATFHSLEFCSHPKILVVDDDEFNILAVKSILKSKSLTISFARNGAQAIELLHRQIAERKECCTKFQLILMDVNMPVLGGLETTRILKQEMREMKLPWMPIIGCTAFVGSSDEKLCRENGMDDYEAKPLNDKKITRLIEKWIVD